MKIMNQSKNTFATLSLIFGILSILTGCFCLGGFLGILGIVFFVTSYKSIGKTSLNTAGLITSIIGILLSLVIFAAILKSPSSDNTTESATEINSTTELTTTEEVTTETATEFTEKNTIESENLSPDMFVNDVKAAIQTAINSKDESIKDVILENKDLCVYVDFSQTDPSPLTFETLAISRTASITDAILELTQYESLWNSITIDFGELGYIRNSKENMKNSESGAPYFSSENFKLEGSTIKNTTTEEVTTEEQVWIPSSGSKYHSNSSCSNMKNPRQVSKSEAESMGYSPCKRCH